MGDIEGRLNGEICVMHTLAKSYPSMNGYTIRSHEILMAQNKTDGVTSFALTSPYYRGIYDNDELTIADGVEYLRTPLSNSSKEANQSKIRASMGGKMWLLTILRKIYSPFYLSSNLIKEWFLMSRFQRRIEEVIRERGPSVIHAHTPFKVGLPSMKAAKKMQKPFVYEVRGIWEESAVSRGSFTRWSPRYWRFRLMETKTMKNADLVFCISKELKSELISRGIPEHKIFIIKNGAPSRFLEECEAEKSSKEKNSELKLIEEIKNERSIIGYAGSVQEYEGLNLLIEGVKNLIDCGLDVSLLIISNETDVAKLLEFCENMGVGDYVHITGPVSRSEIRSYLNMIDVFVVPRLDDSRMSRMVTPMKQMEPMALGIPLLISDIKAIRGITGEGLVTTFEPGSMEDLSEKIRFLISGDKRVQEKVKKGVEWVRKEGTWDISVEKAIDLYNHLIRNESS